MAPLSKTETVPSARPGEARRPEASRQADEAASSPTPPASVTIVCCVEHGALEAEAVLMARSLRTFGGSLATVPILAIRPRLGPPLARQTRAAFDKLNVTYITASARGRYRWYAFLNKVRCLEVAEEFASTEQLMWLDSDILVLGDPAAICLGPQEQLCAIPGSAHGGTTGPDDPDEELWRIMCQATGLHFDDLPWLLAPVDGKRVRFYLNSGVYTVRRDVGFADMFRRCVTAVLDAGVLSAQWRLNLLEQAAFGLAILRAGLSYRLAPYIYNMHVGPGIEPYYDAQTMRQAVLLHYHKSLKPSYWPAFLRNLAADRPQMYDWCRSQGPISFQRRLTSPHDSIAACLRLGWRLQRVCHERWRCRVPMPQPAASAQ